MAGEIRRQLFEYLEYASHRDQFGAELAHEHARARVAAHARHGATTQRPVDVHTAIGHHLGTGADGGGDDQVAVARVQPQTGPNRIRSEEHTSELKSRE